MPACVLPAHALRGDRERRRVGVLAGPIEGVVTGGDDLAAARPDKLAELLALWDRYVEDTGVILDPISLFDVDQQNLAQG